LLSLHGIGQPHRQVTIETLPEDVLLEIFDYYLDEGHKVEGWHKLIHVCRRWRNVVFASPRRLDLTIFFRPTRCVREMQDIWPELPIYISYSATDHSTVECVDNVIAALELKDRASRILCSGSSSVLERFTAVMQFAFPTLTDLALWSSDGMALVLSDSFLGGSAPGLRQLDLYGIPFPTLPRLLLSATDLVLLKLWDIPHSGYISPEAIVTCLSTLTRLRKLFLSFRSPRSRPDHDKASQPPPPLAHLILPSLTYLYFQGVTEYFEDLVAQIDVPLLEDTDIILFNQLVFDISHFPKFLRRAEKYAVLDQADVVLHPRSISLTLSSKSGTVGLTKLNLSISCSKLDWQLSSLAQVCDLTLSALPSLDRLSIREYQYSPPDWQDDIENTQWLELFQSFTTVKDLHISKQVASCVAPALQDSEFVGERVVDLLPALQNLFVIWPQPSGPIHGIEQFIAARELSGYPVALHL
jgi:hypothetical protein